MVPALLQFLTILPDEINSNTKIPITVRTLFTVAIHLFDMYQDEEYQERETALLTANSERVLDLLTMYLGAPGAYFFCYDTLSMLRPGTP